MLYGADTRTTHGECFQSAGCLTCWEKCGSLNPEDGEDTWTPCHLLPDCVSIEYRVQSNEYRVLSNGPVLTPCHLLPDCDDAGCRLACQFHSLPRAAPPALPPCRPDLELSRDGAEARWSLSESKCDRPRSGVVFLLLAGAGDGWQELVQTPAESVLLVNVGLDTPLRLLAVGRDGPLAVAELQSDDATATDGRQSHERKPPSDGVWLLETVSVERDSSSMVLVQVGWQRHRSAGAAPPQYLVTWELSGGGIKGHLYTDINSVTLSLWPESVYNIQVRTGERCMGMCYARIV
ncbi:Transmembrane protein fend [Amphibalanus amphitrite]|uniref:Transmembrane protein fend n=1 Tax=Amphibalanus amphitrite TaxID=1232801 RepID=A0A6A4X1F6_AMPAM|nr:Transmembrane protein fend [Amphibalanus amphitrite]